MRPSKDPIKSRYNLKSFYNQLLDVDSDNDSKNDSVLLEELAEKEIGRGGTATT